MPQQPHDIDPATTLHGRVILVTGAGSGLGAAVSQSLARSGAHVVIADLDEDKAQSQAARICSEGISAEVSGRGSESVGDRVSDRVSVRVRERISEPSSERTSGKSGEGALVRALALDVGDPAAAAAAVAQTVEWFGRIDVLINNAGTDLTLPIDQILPEHWRRIIDTNLNGAFYMAREAAMAMRRTAAASGNGQVRGHIINIASTPAKRGWPNASACHASKWGLLGLSHALHAELRAQGIKLTAVVAGGMRTPLLLDRFPDIDLRTLQEPASVAAAIHSVLMMPEDSVIAEITVLPMHESSWP